MTGRCTADYDGFTVYLGEREPAGQSAAPAAAMAGRSEAAGEQSCPAPGAGAALALPGHDSGDACAAAEGAAAGEGVSSGDPRDPGSGAEPGGGAAGAAQRAFRRASSSARDAATANLIRRHAARLAELNRRGAGEGGAGGRECSVM